MQPATDGKDGSFFLEYLCIVTLKSVFVASLPVHGSFYFLSSESFIFSSKALVGSICGWVSRQNGQADGTRICWGGEVAKETRQIRSIFRLR